MKLGCFGLAMEAKKDLRLEKGTQAKGRMEQLGPADMFAQMRVTDQKIKGVI